MDNHQVKWKGAVFSPQPRDGVPISTLKITECLSITLQLVFQSLYTSMFEMMTIKADVSLHNFSKVYASRESLNILHATIDTI